MAAHWHGAVGVNNLVVVSNCILVVLQSRFGRYLTVRRNVADVAHTVESVALPGAVGQIHGGNRPVAPITACDKDAPHVIDQNVAVGDMTVVHYQRFGGALGQEKPYCGIFPDGFRSGPAAG